jgi:hypothetical protein
MPFMGSTIPGCCQGSGECGGQLPLDGSFLCLAPNADTLVNGLNTAFAGITPAPVLLDPACPSVTLAGTPLAGCCDRTGVCGVSTQAWGRAAAQLGLKVPSSCLTPDEASRVPGIPTPGDGETTSCSR